MIDTAQVRRLGAFFFYLSSRHSPWSGKRWHGSSAPFGRNIDSPAFVFFPLELLFGTSCLVCLASLEHIYKIVTGTN